MREYRLGPDELIAKDFRLLQSSRPRFKPYGKKEWIVAVQKIYNKNSGSRGFLQKSHPYLYNQGVWIFAMQTVVCERPDSILRVRGSEASGRTRDSTER